MSEDFVICQKDKIKFRVFQCENKFDKQLVMYQENSKGEIFVPKIIKWTKYNRSTPLPSLCDVTSEDLRELSNQLYKNDLEDAYYLKGNLEATKNHLSDLQKIIFKNK